MIRVTFNTRFRGEAVIALFCFDKALDVLVAIKTETLIDSLAGIVTF